MKIILIIPTVALLLAGCAASPAGDGATSASASEERYVPLGTYLPRKKSQLPDNGGAVDKTQLENMQRTGVGTGAASSY